MGRTWTLDASPSWVRPSGTFEGTAGNRDLLPDRPGLHPNTPGREPSSRFLQPNHIRQWPVTCDDLQREDERKMKRSNPVATLHHGLVSPGNHIS